MRILLKAIILLSFYYSSSIVFTIPPAAAAFTTTTPPPSSSSTNTPHKNGFYFHSAKKITGASSSSYHHGKPKPHRTGSSSWQSSSSASSGGSRRYQASTSSSSTTTTTTTTTTTLWSSSSDDADDDDEERVEPGKMRVSEIKAELDLRDVSYTDCFDKESLIERLHEARSTGKANPQILEKFNKQKLEETYDPDKKVALNDEDIASAVANDGKLPGGLTPEQFKKLSGNTEIMSLLQSTKMQEAMTLMMSGGRDELESKLKDDPELQETLTKLDAVMKVLMS